MGPRNQSFLAPQMREYRRREKFVESPPASPHLAQVNRLRDTSSTHRISTALLLALVPLGILARLTLSAISWGSNDAATWLRCGEEVARHGPLRIYAMDGEYNHPP